MRGRLVFPFLVELAQLDTAATEADPDGAGPLTSGYHEHFREPLMVLAAPTDQTGVSARVEATPIQFRAQIEPVQFERLEMMLGGDSPDSRFAIIAHYRDLENLNLIDSVTGKPLIRKNDRLVRILNCDTGALIEAIPDPPGLFVRQVQSRGFGPGRTRNILLIEFEEREQSVRAAG